MKFKFFSCVFAVWLTLSGAVLAQNPSPNVAADAPKIAIKQTEFNFGEVKKGLLAQHSFVFKNEGKTDLTIKNVAPS